MANYILPIIVLLVLQFIFLSLSVNVDNNWDGDGIGTAHNEDEYNINLGRDESSFDLQKENKLFRIPSPDESLHIYALPMGQGECTIIQCPGGDIIIIDMGSVGSGWSASRVYSFLSHQLSQVKTIIVSNTSPEHYNFLTQVVGSGRTSVNRIILGGKVENYGIYSKFVRWLNTYKNRLEIVNNGKPCITDCNVEPIVCGDVRFNSSLKILGANLGQNHSNSGIILQIITRGFKLMLPGDFSGHDMEELITYEWNSIGYPLSSTHYKLSKHGSTNQANGEAFLEAVSPQYAFTSNAYPDYQNGWDPSCETVWRLLNIQTIRKSKYVGKFSCGDVRQKEPVQYNNWPYEIHSTSADPYYGKLIRINVNLTSADYSQTSIQSIHVELL